MKKKNLLCFFICLLSFLTLTALARHLPTTAPQSKQPLFIVENEINGVDGDLLENVRETLRNEQGEANFLTALDIHHFYEQAPKLIQESLQPFGYFKAQVHSRLTHTGKHWLANYTINLGPPLRITRIHLNPIGEGAQSKEIQKEIAAFPLHVGDIFATKTYSQAKQFLIDQAMLASYIKAHFTINQVHISLSHYKAALILDFDTGPRYFFGQISFSPTHFNPGFLERFLPFKMGEPYNTAKLTALQQRFHDSNYFQEIEITPHLDTEDPSKIPVQIKLKPTKSQEYLAGIGYGTDTGPRGQLSFNFPQLGHNGEQIRGWLKASSVHSKLLTSYSIPGTDPVTSHYTISVSIEHQNQPIGKSTTSALIASDVTRLSNHWDRTINLHFVNDQSTLPNKTAIASNLLLYPSISWLKLNTDNPLNPTKGYRLGINLLGAPKTTVSSIRFFQMQVNAKKLQSLSNKNRLVLHGTIGHTEVTDLNRLPLFLRFYTGGTQNIRGYAFQSIGPGRHLLEMSAEIQHEIYPAWYLGLFYDTGNASERLLPRLKRGVGTGIVWLSPVGAIQLSIAKALDAPGRPLRIQFNMRPDL